MRNARTVIALAAALLAAACGKGEKEDQVSPSVDPKGYDAVAVASQPFSIGNTADRSMAGPVTGEMSLPNPTGPSLDSIPADGEPAAAAPAADSNASTTPWG
jgi:hypothetical protein